MARLLVSVRDTAEARCAAIYGADIIDIKEPLLGALGRAPAHVVEDICRAVSDIPISVAMGELSASVSRKPLPALLTERSAFAKAGASRCKLAEWLPLWREWLMQLPAMVAPIAVVYADWQLARSPQPRDLVKAAGDHGAAGILIDTFCKSNQDLFGYLDTSQLHDVIQLARSAELTVAIAGSLSMRTLPLLIPLLPDIIAVRGAACVDGRLGRVDPNRVRALSTAIARMSELQRRPEYSTTMRPTSS